MTKAKAKSPDMNLVRENMVLKLQVETTERLYQNRGREIVELIKTHDRRVKDLLEANNRHLDDGRAARAEIERLKSLLPRATVTTNTAGKSITYQIESISHEAVAQEITRLSDRYPRLGYGTRFDEIRCINGNIFVANGSRYSSCD